MLHRNRYDCADAAARASYDGALQAFSAKSERDAYSWTERVISRMGSLSALAGRDTLRDALVRLGLLLR